MNPKTVHYINRFHFFFETTALLFVVPEFLPIFGVDFPINSVKASVYAAVGNRIDGKPLITYICYIIGQMYFFTTRFRLFCLVRHKRNNWINALYLGNTDAKRVNSYDVATTLSDAASNPRKLLRKTSKFAPLPLVSVIEIIFEF